MTCNKADRIETRDMLIATGLVPTESGGKLAGRSGSDGMALKSQISIRLFQAWEKLCCFKVRAVTKTSSLQLLEMGFEHSLQKWLQKKDVYENMGSVITPPRMQMERRLLCAHLLQGTRFGS